MSLFDALRHRQFAFLWVGQTVSQVGDSVYNLALAWYVLERTGSASAAALTLTFTFIPRIAFLALGGVVVDRLPRAGVVLVSDLLRGVSVGLAALLAATGQLEMWHIYALGG